MSFEPDDIFAISIYRNDLEHIAALLKAHGQQPWFVTHGKRSREISLIDEVASEDLLPLHIVGHPGTESRPTSDAPQFKIRIDHTGVRFSRYPWDDDSIGIYTVISQYLRRRSTQVQRNMVAATMLVCAGISMTTLHRFPGSLFSSVLIFAAIVIHYGLWSHTRLYPELRGKPPNWITRNWWRCLQGIGAIALTLVTPVIQKTLEERFYPTNTTSTTKEKSVGRSTPVDTAVSGPSSESSQSDAHEDHPDQ